MKRTIAFLTFFVSILCANAQLPKVYDEAIDPVEQIDSAVAKAADNGKYVICQVGGNWCRWCLMFADFITKDAALAEFIDNNYVYIHVNYPRENVPAELGVKLGNPGRFGFPVLVVLDDAGKVIHIQDSEFLEEGKGYNRDKVMRFLKNWTPEAVKG